MGLHSVSLISLGKICDNECIAILDKNKININKDSKLVLNGHLKKSDRLWDIPISNPLRHGDNAIITRDKTNAELIQSLHGFFLRPTLRKFMRVIKNGNLLIWLGLNNKTLLRHHTYQYYNRIRTLISGNQEP